MIRLIILFFCVSFYQIGFSQTENLNIEGAINISNSENPNPVAGTIRWTGLDFEGFDGKTWKSFMNRGSSGNSDPVLTCPTQNVVLNNCNLTVNWTHQNPQSTTVNYTISMNGIDLGITLDYPSTSYTVDMCSLLGISSGSGTVELELFYWYDGNSSAPRSAGVCMIPYDLGIQSNQCMTYAQIRAAGRAENCYNRDSPNAHLAEFLYMKPTVSHWTNDPVNEIICAIDAPEPGPLALQAPPPTGGDDASMIETFINNNSGAEIVGTGTYQFGSTIVINVPVKIWDMPSKLIGSIGITYIVNAPNVEMYRSLIDAQNLASANTGWRLESTANNFVLSTSGIENILHRNNRNVDGVLIVGASDYHITCNKFNNLLSDFPGSPIVRAIRSSVYNRVYPAPAGYIANNESENLQSSNGNAGGTGGGALFYVIQGYTGSNGTAKLLANRCVNAGKRLAKCQNPDVFAASNSWHWKDLQGPFGQRKMLAVIDCQLDADRVIAMNNRIKIEAGGKYDALLEVAPQFNDYAYTDIHFDCNDIELIDTPPASYHALGAYFINKDQSSPDNRNQLINCSVKDNVFRGPGGTSYMFSFGPGYIDDATGLGIDLTGNIVTTPILQSVFRGSNAPLP